MLIRPGLALAWAMNAATVLAGMMKIAAALAIIGIVVAEFIASQAGLGYLILFASSRQQTDLSLACIAALCAVGLLLYGLTALAERLLPCGTVCEFDVPNQASGGCLRRRAAAHRPRRGAVRGVVASGFGAVGGRIRR
jgi:hypothetical protein